MSKLRSKNSITHTGIPEIGLGIQDDAVSICDVLIAGTTAR